MAKLNERYRITLGKIIPASEIREFMETDDPIIVSSIEVNVQAPDEHGFAGKNETIGYMSVFRDYSIDITVTKDGIIRLGTAGTPYISKKIHNMRIHDATDYLVMLCKACILDFSTSYHAFEYSNNEPYWILPYFDDKRNLLTYAKTIIPELNALYMCYHSCENPVVPEPDFYNNFVASKN